MKTWTISEQARRGIKVINASFGDYRRGAVVIGSGRAMIFFPLGDDLQHVFEQGIAKREAGHLVDTVDIDVHGVMSMRLDNCELSQDRSCLTKSQDWNRNVAGRCIVLVETCAGHNGRLWLTDSTSKAEERGNRVAHVPAPFPPPGVDIIAQSKGPLGEPHSLLMMAAGSRFRIHRSGYIPHDESLHASSCIELQWNGRHLNYNPMQRRRQKAS